MTENLKRMMCARCNKEFESDPCEPSDCWILDVLNGADADDLVRVVRCVNCKHFHYNMENDTYCSYRNYFREGLSDPEENDFCSYGERKGDDV